MGVYKGFTVHDSSNEPIYFGIKPEAVDAWRKLCSAQDKNPYYPCKNNPYFYTDYDGKGFETEDGKPQFLTADQCEELCHGCPLLKECYDFAVANDEPRGVWGGINFAVKDNTIF